jgi:hypothetical protein
MRRKEMMDIYQYDTPDGFCIRVEGALVDNDIDELEDAWMCAQSVLNGRRIVVDIAAIDAGGMDLLIMLRDSGTQLIASQKPADPALAATLGVAPPPSSNGRLPFLRRLWLSIQP